jgi:hypothetical protein
MLTPSAVLLHAPHHHQPAVVKAASTSSHALNERHDYATATHHLTELYEVPNNPITGSSRGLFNRRAFEMAGLRPAPLNGGTPAMSMGSSGCVRLSTPRRPT